MDNISIIIRNRNEAEHIGFALQSVKDHYNNPEIIIIDNDLPGRDNKFAILPSDLANLSSYIKLREEMQIDDGLDYHKCEIDSRNNYTGRFNG